MIVVNANSFPDLPPIKSLPKELSEAWLETYSGKRFHFLGPQQDEIDIEDIAHALANECRFGGHTSSFYSVAEHSILVATLCPDNLALGALLHDASEAYIRDIPSPVKHHLTNYKEIENIVQGAIERKFGVVGASKNPIIKEADTMALKAEARNLLKGGGEAWIHQENYKTRAGWESITPHCLDPKEAKQMFMKIFEYLTAPKILVPEKEIVIAR